MFVAQNLVFTELHKTGGTHICKWLDRFVDGKQLGKHNRIPSELWDRFIIGSIRNPWDWYVSLWAYGCGGQGSVYQQATKRVDFDYLVRQLHTEMATKHTSPVYGVRQFVHNLFKPVQEWNTVYQDFNDTKAFRAWLRLMLNCDHRFDFGEGYGFSPIAVHSGLLTYRFMKLFTRLGEGLYRDSSLANPESLRRAWQQNRLVDFVIRMEALENDLLDAISKSGTTLTADDESALMAAQKNKTNTSKRLPASCYFDSQSIELVANKECLIIELYGYQPPVI